MNWKYIIPLFVIAVACETAKESEAVIETETSNTEILSVIDPIEGTEEAPRVFKVSAQSSNTIDLGNGGSLEFPENAFVDKNGNPVSGEVDVEWQEFHSLGDIMLSGIPMKYDSAGVQFDLVSGGMFTINASQNGSPVEIAPKKEVGVNVASIQDTPCFNFYEMDEKSGEWKYETTKVGEKIEEEKTEVAQSAGPPDLLDVNLSTRKFPDLAKLDIVGWQVKRKLSDADKSKLKARTTRLRLVETDSLGLTLEVKLSAKRTERYPVEPYTLDQAMKDSKANRQDLQKSIAATRQFEKEMAAGRVIRSISIDNFGTYNWDIINKRDNSLPLFAKFNYPKGVNPQLVSLFLISPEENVIVSYNPAGDSKFSFDPNLKNCLIAILPGNKVVSVPNEGFTTARGLKKGQVCEFTFRETGIKLTSANDIMNHMNVLI
ncbi:MAG: hypothetical protein P8P74_18700 [Crocinitomicaceae bacterium]|nr:hypothetical protein [Crocinitomicaceae bacterium]